MNDFDPWDEAYQTSADLKDEHRIHLVRAPGSHVMCGKRVDEVLMATTERGPVTCAGCCVLD